MVLKINNEHRLFGINIQPHGRDVSCVTIFDNVFFFDFTLRIKKRKIKDHLMVKHKDIDIELQDVLNVQKIGSILFSFILFFEVSVDELKQIYNQFITYPL